MMMAQQKVVENFSKNMALDKEDYGGKEQPLDHKKDEGKMGFTKELMGNPGTIMKGVGNLKQKMQIIFKEFEQIGKMVRGEHTLGHYIDQLSEVIGNVEEVKKSNEKGPNV